MEDMTMARFPQGEPEIAALARRVISGLGTATEDFPNPPVPPDELQVVLDEYEKAKDEALVADGESREMFALKDEAIERLTDAMRADIRYAENTARHDPERLRRLGWGGRKDRTSLVPPGQPRSLSVASEGPGWLVLDWKPPVEGGSVQAYRIQCSEGDVEQWADVGSAVETEGLISNQKRNTKFVYRVLAVNKSGLGEPSNIVTAVL
jgi:hypothetical protein